MNVLNVHYPLSIVHCLGVSFQAGLSAVSFYGFPAFRHKKDAAFIPHAIPVNQGINLQIYFKVGSCHEFAG